MKVLSFFVGILGISTAWGFSKLNTPERNYKNTNLKPVTESFLFYGDINPTGFFDPLKLTNTLSEQNLKYLRECELHHGRIAMTSALILPTLELLDNDNLAINILRFSGIGINEACLSAMGMFELSRLIAFFEPPRIQLFKLKESIQPGQLNPYFDLYNNTDLANKELSNGRLAMIGVLGFLVQELVTQQRIF